MRIKKSDSAYKRAEKLVDRWVNREYIFVADIVTNRSISSDAEESLIRAIARELKKLGWVGSDD